MLQRMVSAAVSSEEGAAAPCEEALRILEAVLFAAAEPMSEAELARRLPPGADVGRLIARLAADYAPRGVNLVRVAGKWMFRTASDLGYLLSRDAPEPKRLSRAALETLAIIAYHQPVTRAEIEEIRGVSTNKGTLDVLLETGWARLRGRRRSPGRPVTYGTTEAFLVHFGLESIGDLPGLEELKGAGFLDNRLPATFAVPVPSDDPALRPDEDPLEAGEATELDLGMLPREPEEDGEAGDGPAVGEPGATDPQG
ncbi:segregation and condensation protein B [Blastochloris viridis]|uniref:Segregation and condensation protein B n=1 Tax=Blastochloris viridis TaxID=1079 RepID=A0A182D5P6_BLAVI|nr:segregation and condensation protein B [Blastochloris viridis]